MNRELTIARLRELAASLGETAVGSQWYLFGSVNRDEADANDIDLLIVCYDNFQADAIRKSIDPDCLELPLHLAFMTIEEETEISAVQMQQGWRVFP
ncbi:MAG: hypothetical protein KDA78_06565 [Planctomycetaceae bacterium]|nr:hypothetical protein [Planctomycetaceae bacterium]